MINKLKYASGNKFIYRQSQRVSRAHSKGKQPTPREDPSLARAPTPAGRTALRLEAPSLRSVVDGVGGERERGEDRPPRGTDAEVLPVDPRQAGGQVCGRGRRVVSTCVYGWLLGFLVGIINKR